MRKQILTSMIMCFLVTLIFTTGLCGQASAKQIKLKVVSFTFLDSLENKMLQLFIERVNERAKGELFMDLIGGPEIISPFELAQSVSKGIIDVGLNSTSFYPGTVPGAEAYLASKLSIQELRKNGFHDFVIEQHKKANLYYLGAMFESVDTWNIFLTKPVTNLNELKGLRLGDGTVALPFLKKIGAVSVTLGLEESYTALDRGIADGILYPRLLIPQFKLDEKLKYYIEGGFFRNDTSLFMNLNKWNSLPKHLQKIMQEVAISLEKDSENYANKVDMDIRKAMETSGVKKIILPEADKKKMLDLIYQTEWEQAVERYPDFGPELVNTLR
ncbi:MAG: hypothetical protein DRH93_14215 [Deltaproteobacteria bacterium]|nr:MAG: hypothetical protein DRH93_14215 [Deltaproteobacteria bacterium]